MCEKLKVDVAPDEDDGDHFEQPPVLGSEPARAEAFASGQLPGIEPFAFEFSFSREELPY